jgi:predicted HD superfamily hydrolase involved in NAD metabolism
MNPERYIKILKTHLDGELYRHSLGVADTAADLARRYGADRRKAYLAGLVHDFGKGYSPAWLRRKAARLGLRLDRVTAAETRLLHAPVGAALLPGKLGIKDPAVIRAVAFHTTGRRGMTLLEKIVYLADLIEPERSFPGVDGLRQLALVSLEGAVLAAVERTIGSILERGLLLHPRSVELRNSLLAGSRKNGGKK